jgi:disulfide bond formation protein DsbB
MAANSKSSDQSNAWWYLCVAWSLSLIATLSVLFIGEVLGQMPCTLCWYQRIPMFALVFILGVGCLRPSKEVSYYATPLIAVGLIISVYHSLQYGGVVLQKMLPCGAVSCTGNNMTILDGIALPYSAVVCFAAILVLTLIFTRKFK